MLCLLEILPNFVNLKFEISNLKSQAEGISRQLRGWADSLQESQIPGQRYLAEKTRRASQARQDRDNFLKELESIRASGSKPPASPIPAPPPIPIPHEG